MIGKTLAHYEITSQLGKGGMGEVYQAKDTKLGRDVAIKVLPEEFAFDPNRVTRFQREAKLLASLNHPNIAILHGLEESEGIHFLVMELIPGDTLADRLKGGPIPVEEALKFAFQIAEALEAAHEKGVIHRDLKPANIKVTPEGKVKVLDFGLAKAYAGETEVSDLADSPTLSDAATRQGIILGTAAYMSPEQARGKAVDKRADIWSFGVVLYEMLAWKALFAGEDITSTLARVLERKPDFSMLPENLHPRIRFLLVRCLNKDVRDRYGTISDARVDIQEVLSNPGGAFAWQPSGGESRTRQRSMAMWATLTVFLIAVSGTIIWSLKPIPPPQVIRFDYDLPEGRQLNFTEALRFGHTLAVSTDGSQFAFSTSEGIYLRSVDEMDAHLVPGTDEDPQSPFFSPDDKWIGYWSRADNKLKKISVGGGVPVALCDASWIYGAIWYPDGTIIYSEVMTGAMRISANGGKPEILIQGTCIAPQLLPDEKTVIFTEVAKAAQYEIVVQSLESGKRRALFQGAAARYLPSGHLVYSSINDQSILAVPFDPDSLEVIGGAIPVVEGAGISAVSDSGTLVYTPRLKNTDDLGGPNIPRHTLVWVDREGREEPLGADPNAYEWLKISPDGNRVVLSFKSRTDNYSDLWIWETARKNLTRLTNDNATDGTPLWARDGRNIIFRSDREPPWTGIYRKAADGTGKVEKLGILQGRLLYPSSLSRDGNSLFIAAYSLEPFRSDIGMMSMEGGHELKTLLEGKQNALYPVISPDGKWLAYQSNESGREEIYVRPFPEVEKGRSQVSTNGGNSPLWSPDGRELFYRNGDATMAVAVESEPVFTPENPEVLFRGAYFSSVAFYGDDITLTPWDIHSDGKRFLMIKEPEAGAGESGNEGTANMSLRKINVVVNWIEELKQQVPDSK